MGGFTPATAALSLLQIAKRVDSGQAAARAAEAENEARAREAEAQQAAEARDRQERLRRGLARQRAQFGAQGIASGSGSARALLGGLEAEAMAADAESRRMADLRLGRLARSSPALSRRSFISLLEP